MGAPRRIGRELARHSTFIEDGRRLLEALVRIPGAQKVKAGWISGRRSKEKKIVLEPGGTGVEITLGNTEGHQTFRASGDAALAERLAAILLRKFPEYMVVIRRREVGR